MNCKVTLPPRPSNPLTIMSYLRRGVTATLGQKNLAHARTSGAYLERFGVSYATFRRWREGESAAAMAPANKVNALAYRVGRGGVSFRWPLNGLSSFKIFNELKPLLDELSLPQSELAPLIGCSVRHLERYYGDRLAQHLKLGQLDRLGQLLASGVYDRRGGGVTLETKDVNVSNDVNLFDPPDFDETSADDFKGQAIEPVMLSSPQIPELPPSVTARPRVLAPAGVPLVALPLFDLIHILRDERKVRGLPESEVAKAVGVSENLLLAWEAGKTWFGDNTLRGTGLAAKVDPRGSTTRTDALKPQATRAPTVVRDLTLERMESWARALGFGGITTTKFGTDFKLALTYVRRAHSESRVMNDTLWGAAGYLDTGARLPRLLLSGGEATAMKMPVVMFERLQLMVGADGLALIGDRSADGTRYRGWTEDQLDKYIPNMRDQVERAANAYRTSEGRLTSGRGRAGNPRNSMNDGKTHPSGWHFKHTRYTEEE